VPETQIPPGSATASKRAAMLTASPNRFVPSTITSPTWMPMRNRIVSPAAPSAFSFPMASWTATAHCTASTALAKVGDDAVACGVEDPAAMCGDQPVDDFAAGLEPREGADLVLPHQPAMSAAKIAASFRSTAGMSDHPLVLRPQFVGREPGAGASSLAQTSCG